ncbi:MAG: metallophosphoesterase [Candidatus Margulisbacteria bacterium]|nr:metallophosphoesterase [Candidatus Margulisiibacteriota bacterium]
MMKRFVLAVFILGAIMLASGCEDSQVFNTSVTAPSPFAEPLIAGRNKIVVISDIHMGEERAADAAYCWFTENAKLLECFLDEVAQSEQVKTLVIAGDFFDEWIVPMETAPFQSGITSSEGYFLSVANAPLNINIVNKLKAIVNAGTIEVVYVPGNHDMLMTEAIMQKIIPGITWAGTSTGMGDYWPSSHIVMEHGHRYDFFNSPDSLTQAGSLLPPGYFVSRVFASKSAANGPVVEEDLVAIADLEFVAAWDIAIAEINIHGLDKDAKIIKMGIDGYTADMSVNDAKDNYKANIGSQWDQRQSINGVYSKMTETSAILAGSGIGWWGDLEDPADLQYLVPGRAKIVVFGHSHKAMLKKNLVTLEKIYANTGTWIDAKYVKSGYATRSFVVISPSISRGSETDTVTLYQYNGTGEVSKLAEESVKVN